jgi:hypothetical protein
MRYDLLVREACVAFRQDKPLLPERIVKTTVLFLWPLSRENTRLGEKRKRCQMG